MTTISPSELLAELARFGVKVYLKDGGTVIRHPWPGWKGVPREAQDLLRQLKRLRLAVKLYLEAEERARLHREWVIQNARDHLFPYPLPETLGIGKQDPMDFRFDVDRRAWVYDPGWWRDISEREQVH